MSDSGDFNDNSVDSVENEENNNVKSDKKKEKKEVKQMSNVMNNNNSDKSDDFQIENNEDESNKQNLKDSSEDIINNNNNSNNKNEIKEIPERQLLNLNKDNSSFSSFNSEKKKDAIILEVDEEKTKRNNFTVYQLIEIKQDSNSYNKKTKKILCYRRYSEFDKFYNKLKSRYPHCIFPRLSQKLYIKKEDPINVENRRKELQYFLNRLYYHEEISKSEEFKRFINSTFDAQYFDNLPNKYSYPESFKANNDQSYWNFGIKKIKGLFSNTKEHTQSEKEKQILSREEEFKNKSTKYSDLLKDIKNLYENVEATKNEYKLISNNMLFLKDDKNKKDDNDDEDYKNNFNELIDLNKNLSEIYDNNTKNDLVDIIDQLNYCILDVEGINRAIERFRNFIKDYETVKNAKAVNKYVSEEKSKVEHDKEDFEDNILKDLKKYDRENDFIYEQIIEKLINYIKKINEDGLKAFNETNFN
jgi:hypothetical protein